MLSFSLIIAATLTVSTPAQSATASPAQIEINTCVLCHGTPEFWKADQQHLYVPSDSLENDVHYQRGVKCYQCHGGNPTSLDPEIAHASDQRAVGLPFGSMTKTCGTCHEKQRIGLEVGVHQGLINGQVIAGQTMSCRSCHTDKAHNILPVSAPESPVYLKNQVQQCSECHEVAAGEYLRSAHGHSVFKSGLDSAVCADCHGAHGIFRASHKDSMLHVTRVADTCAQCHRLVQETLNKSVHGMGAGLGREGPNLAPGGDARRRPSCTDCHVGHDLPDPQSAGARQQQGDRCGSCHVELQTSYRMSMHGELTNLGYDAGAKCSDCHGAHGILAIDNPDSLMSKENRLTTCAECHPGIAPNLATFDPHANHRDAQRSPLVFWVFRGVAAFIICVFGVFGAHAIFLFFRGLIDVARHGRPAQMSANEAGFRRFTRFHRWAHSIMVVSFLGVALTGLPLKFSSYQWAQWLAAALGGFAFTGFWHRFFSITMFGCFGAYVFYLLRSYWVMRRSGATILQTVFGPDSPVPGPSDVKYIFRTLKWFVGLGPRPTFDRWAYWEKFDFFGAGSDIILIGTSGLILWFPDFFCLFLPGEAVNVAKVVHSTLALLATGFVFAIHFFGTHIRPEKFPMDMSILTGVVSEEDMHHERAEQLARLEREGRLEEMRARAPGPVKLFVIRVLGFIALFLGLGALAGIIWSLIL